MKKLTFLLITGLAFLSGCAKYRARNLKRIAPIFTAQQEDASLKHTVVVSAQLLSSEDAVKFLGRDIYKAGYVPVQLALINDSNHYMDFKLNNMSVKTVPYDIVFKNAAYSPVKRFIGWGVASLIIWPLIVPAVVDTIWAVDANKHMLADYQTKSLTDKLLEPHSRYEGLVFVPQYSYKNRFNVVLVDQNTGKPVVCRINYLF